MLDRVDMIEQPTYISYKHLETFNFPLCWTKILNTNLNSLHLCFTMKFNKETNVALNLENDLITVNNFFALWIIEINITKFGTDEILIRTSTPMDIYQYSDAMLKHLPEKV